MGAHFDKENTREAHFIGPAIVHRHLRIVNHETSPHTENCGETVYT